MISKIIHHIAPNDRSKWFPLWVPCYESWLKNFPNYKHMMWDDYELLDFVASNYQEWIDFYNELPYNIMRYDVARLLLLHYYGGTYADMDVYCYKNFEYFLDQDLKIVDVSLHSKQVSIDNKPHGIETFLMASKKQNSFFLNCLDLIKKRWLEKKIILNKENYNQLIQYITGPYAVQEVFKLIYNESNLFPKHLFSNVEGYYSEELYTRHLSCTVWTGWMNLSHQEKLNSFFPPRPYLTSKNFSFYKNYCPILRY